MLMLARKRGQKIVVDHGGLVIEITEIRGDKVRVGITAHPDVTVHRDEVEDAIAYERKQAGEPPLRPLFYPGAKQ